MSTTPTRPRPRGPDRSPDTPSPPDTARPDLGRVPARRAKEAADRRPADAAPRADEDPAAPGVPSPPRPHPRLDAGIALVLGALFLGSGISKLVAPDFLVRSFEQWGYGSTFMTIVGLAEIVGGVLVVIPATRGSGAALLAVIMVGAVVTHGAAAQWAAMLLPAGVLALIWLLMRPRWADPAWPRPPEAVDPRDPPGAARNL